MMPLKPNQLHKQGTLSLEDPKTWSVKVIEASGVESVYTLEQAKQVLAGKPEASRLPGDVKVEPPTKILSYDKIVLDGTPPKTPLTPKEILLTLQEITAIR
jgi:hypothetical protein